MTGCCGLLPLRANLWCFSGALLGAYWEPSWAFEGPSWALLAAILGSGEAFLNDLRGQIRKGTILSFRTFLGFLLSFYIFVCFHVFIHCTGRSRRVTPTPPRGPVSPGCWPLGGTPPPPEGPKRSRPPSFFASWGSPDLLLALGSGHFAWEWCHFST